MAAKLQNATHLMDVNTTNIQDLEEQNLQFKPERRLCTFIENKAKLLASQMADEGYINVQWYNNFHQLPTLIF